MPRKPKKPTTQHVNVVVKGKTISISLYPPKGRKKSWYVYWPGLKAATSTGHSDYAKAVKAAEQMVQNNGQRGNVADTRLTDDEFDKIQEVHFHKKQDEAAKERAARSLRACKEAITAFRKITGLKPITTATAEDCERFQLAALKLPKNWRSQHPNSRKDVELLSANTVAKWSIALQAAFERANSNAERKKCVRGVVSSDKLLTENPWKQVNSIKGNKTPIRQFRSDELLSLLAYLEDQWRAVEVASLMAKVLLWSACRKDEVASLCWSSERLVGEECHFEIVGKWGVERWFRIPQSLFEGLTAIRTASRYVFAAYTDQLRTYHLNGSRPWLASRVLMEFNPANLGDWFYERIKDWAKAEQVDAAFIHTFRKTTLQYARSGEDLNKQVAKDAGVSVEVMMRHYAKESDPEMRERSNRTFTRIANSLPTNVSSKFGYVAKPRDPLQERLEKAVACKDFELAARLASELAERNRDVG